MITTINIRAVGQEGNVGKPSYSASPSPPRRCSACTNCIPTHFGWRRAPLPPTPTHPQLQQHRQQQPLHHLLRRLPPLLCRRCPRRPRLHQQPPKLAAAALLLLAFRRRAKSKATRPTTSTTARSALETSCTFSKAANSTAALSSRGMCTRPSRKKRSRPVLHLVLHHPRRRMPVAFRSVTCLDPVRCITCVPRA